MPLSNTPKPANWRRRSAPYVSRGANWDPNGVWHQARAPGPQPHTPSPPRHAMLGYVLLLLAGALLPDCTCCREGTVRKRSVLDADGRGRSGTQADDGERGGAPSVFAGGPCLGVPARERPRPGGMTRVPEWSFEHGTAVGWLGDAIAMARANNPNVPAHERQQPRFQGAFFDPATQAWVDIPQPEPTLRRESEFVVELADDRIVLLQLYGGEGHGGGWIYERGCRCWRSISPAGAPPGEAFSWVPLRAVAVGHYWVFFPSFDGHHQLRRGWALDLDTGQWSLTASEGAPLEKGSYPLAAVDRTTMLTVPAGGASVALYDVVGRQWRSRQFVRPLGDYNRLLMAPDHCSFAYLSWTAPIDRRRSLNAWIVRADGLDPDKVPAAPLQFDFRVLSELASFDGRRLTLVVRTTLLSYERSAGWSQHPLAEDMGEPMYGDLDPLCGDRVLLQTYAHWLFSFASARWSIAPPEGPRAAALVLHTPTWALFLSGVPPGPYAGDATCTRRGDDECNYRVLVQELCAP